MSSYLNSRILVSLGCSGAKAPQDGTRTPEGGGRKEICPSAAPTKTSRGTHAQNEGKNVILPLGCNPILAKIP